MTHSSNPNDPNLSAASAQSRRGFLKHAALVAGAGLAATALAGKGDSGWREVKGMGRGKAANPPKAGETIRMAVIGTGGMGTGHCRAFAGFGAAGKENVQIVAISDVNDLHAESAATAIVESGQSVRPDLHRDYRELLKRDDVHAIVCASPEHSHTRICMDAIAAGKDVYCEKPMGLKLDESLALRETVLENPDKIFIVGTQKIMLPKYREAKRLIEDGAIGKPIFSQASYCRNTPAGEWNYYGIDDRWKPGVNLDWDMWLGEAGPREWDPKVYIRWRRYRDFSTGIIGDLLVHELTPLIMALESVGWPTRVVASGGHYIDKDMENHDQVNLNIEFENGHSMIVAGSTNTEVGLENMIRGNKANLYLNSRHCELRPERPYVDEIEQRRVECPDIGNDQDALRLHWLEAVRSRVQPASTVDLGTKVMVIVDLATRSVWDGHAYRFDRATMTAQQI